MEYRPQLDALRALAILGVLFSHFWNGTSGAGVMGVRLFFVLSGFLITKLLLDRPTLSAFYGRRALRLLPAYYLVLAFAIALNLPAMRATWKWHVIGLTNVLFFLRQTFEAAWPADHLWTLDVEWQFYLVWPFVVLLSPRPLLPYIIVAVIAVGPVFRYFLPADIEETAWTLPFASLDALGIGALLALYTGPAKPIYAAGLVTAPLVIWGLFEGNSVTDFGSIFTFAALVLAGCGGTLKYLERDPLIWLGKISYGVYLYHIFVWAALWPIIGSIKRGPSLFFGLSTLAIMVAWVSYTYFETPIRSWGKRYFRTASAADRAPSASKPTGH
jgi:peptidoglycan/LPS O-acetylase OafA/YrhL